jgi:hypothetical protein
MVLKQFAGDKVEVDRRIQTIKEDLDFLFRLSGEYQLDVLSGVENSIDEDDVPSSEIVENINAIYETLKTIKEFGSFLASEGDSMVTGATEGCRVYGELRRMSKRWK